jgi:hypothetical protein
MTLWASLYTANKKFICFQQNIVSLNSVIIWVFLACRILIIYIQVSPSVVIVVHFCSLWLTSGSVYFWLPALTSLWIFHFYFCGECHISSYI